MTRYFFSALYTSVFPLPIFILLRIGFHSIMLVLVIRQRTKRQSYVHNKEKKKKNVTHAHLMKRSLIHDERHPSFSFRCARATPDGQVTKFVSRKTPMSDCR